MPNSGTMPDPRWAALFEELNRQEVTYAAPHDLTAGRIFVDGPIDLRALFAAIDRVPPRLNIEPGSTGSGGWLDRQSRRRGYA